VTTPEDLMGYTAKHIYVEVYDIQLTDSPELVGGVMEVFKEVKKDGKIPWGFSKRESIIEGWLYYIKLPLPFLWKCKRYDAVEDIILYGWVIRGILLKFAFRSGLVGIGEQESIEISNGVIDLSG